MTHARWRIPLGAVLVHVCIGSVYAWSTLNRPILQLLPNEPWWFSPPYTTFTAALALLGLSAAFGGPWVERRGPRVAAATAGILFGCGLMIGSLGLAMRQAWLVFVGMGLVGGTGCGIGYISPVSTLVKWFPDRRGMATGMAIMGFGGGAFVAGYLNVFLIDRLGVATALAVLGAAYFVVMVTGSRLLQSPPADWAPHGRPAAGSLPRAARRAELSLTRDQAIRTRQFYLLWTILFINVTAGIGILAQASPMMQDMFGRTPQQSAAIVSLISIFNAGGRFLWASASDYIGRRQTYTTFFVVQSLLFLLIPVLAARGDWLAFQASLCIVFTMYGGGFATIPAFLADMFGPANVGAVHGAVLTAWSAAAIAGPVIITELSNRARAALPPGAGRVHIYDTPLQVLAGLLAVGFVLTLLVRPLAAARNASAAGSRSRG